MATISGGDKMKVYLAEVSKKVSRKAVVRVGFLEGATYPATNDDEEPLNVPTVAAIQNFGNGPTPARPFFSKMVKDKSPDWGEKLGNILQKNNFDSEKSLELMGEGIAGQLRESIIETMEPPLSVLTLMARKYKMGGRVITGSVLGALAAERRHGPPDLSGVSTKPLIDSGHMLASVDKEVE